MQTFWPHPKHGYAQKAKKWNESFEGIDKPPGPIESTRRWGASTHYLSVNLLSDIGHFNVHLKSSLMRGGSVGSYVSAVQTLYSRPWIHSHLKYSVTPFGEAFTLFHSSVTSVFRSGLFLQHAPPYMQRRALHCTMNTTASTTQRWTLALSRRLGKGIIGDWGSQIPNTKNTKHVEMQSTSKYQLPPQWKWCVQHDFLKTTKQPKGVFSVLRRVGKKRRRTEKKMKNLEQP